MAVVPIPNGGWDESTGFGTFSVQFYPQYEYIVRNGEGGIITSNGFSLNNIPPDRTESKSKFNS